MHKVLLTKKRDAASVDGMGKLLPVLRIRRGCRVILTQNLAVPLGLVNSAVGTVIDIIYTTPGLAVVHPSVEQMASNTLEIPIVLVQFDTAYYKGGSFLTNTPRVVPICAVEKSFLNNGYVLLSLFPLSNFSLFYYPILSFFYLKT